MRSKRFSVAVMTALVPLSLLTACGSTDNADAPRTSSQAQSTLQVSEQWVKAAPDGMTALFGTLTNTGNTELRVVSGSSPSAGMVQLHEVSDGQMREKQGGYAIAPHGSLTLKPGADHIMLMDLTGPIVAGQEVTVTLRMADGSTQAVTALARDFAGNQENYGK